MSKKWAKPKYSSKLNTQHPLVRNLIGCWLLNEKGGDTAFDTLGKYDGALIGNSTWTDNGIVFPTDGSTDRINLGTVPTNGELSFAVQNECTVVALVDRPADGDFTTPWPRIIEKSSGSSATNGWGVDYVNTNQRYQFIINGGVGTESNSLSTGNERELLVLTYSESTSALRKIYVNGVDQTGSSSVRSFVGNSTALAIGGVPGTADRNWNAGAIHFVYVYDRALTEVEVQALSDDPYQIFNRGEVTLEGRVPVIHNPTSTISSTTDVSSAKLVSDDFTLSTYITGRSRVGGPVSGNIISWTVLEGPYGMSLSGDDYVTATSSASDQIAITNYLDFSDKRYFEIERDASVSDSHVGFGAYFGDDRKYWRKDSYTVESLVDFTNGTNYTFGTWPDRICFAVDFVNGKVWLGTVTGGVVSWYGDPDAGTNPVLTWTPASVPFFGIYTKSRTASYFVTLHTRTENLSATTGQIPTGYVALDSSESGSPISLNLFKCTISATTDVPDASHKIKRVSTTISATTAVGGQNEVLCWWEILDTEASKIGNTLLHSTGSDYSPCYSTEFTATTGKKYWECDNFLGNSNNAIGVSGRDGNSYSDSSDCRVIGTGGSQFGTYTNWNCDNPTSLVTVTDYMSFAVDFDNRKLWVGSRATETGAITWWNSGDPVAGTNPWLTWDAIDYPFFGIQSSARYYSEGEELFWHFLTDELKSTPPTGYSAVGSFDGDAGQGNTTWGTLHSLSTTVSATTFVGWQDGHNVWWEYPYATQSGTTKSVTLTGTSNFHPTVSNEFTFTTGKYYCEVTTPTGASNMHGISRNENTSYNQTDQAQWQVGGATYEGASSLLTYDNPGTVTSSTTLRRCMAFDFDNGKAYLGVINGTTITWEHSGDPVGGTGVWVSWNPANMPIFGLCMTPYNGGTWEWGFADDDMVATNIPTGFSGIDFVNQTGSTLDKARAPFNPTVTISSVTNTPDAEHSIKRLSTTISITTDVRDGYWSLPYNPSTTIDITTDVGTTNLSFDFYIASTIDITTNTPSADLRYDITPSCTAQITTNTPDASLTFTIYSNLVVLSSIDVSSDTDFSWSIGYVYSSLGAVYSLRPVVDGDLESTYYIHDTTVYDDFESLVALDIDSTLIISYAILRQVSSDFQETYHMTTSVEADSSYLYALSVYDFPESNLVSVYSMPDESYELYEPTFSSTVNGEEISVTSLNISCDEDSYCYSFSASLADMTSWTKCPAGELATFVINGDTYTFKIDSRERNREFANDQFNIYGRSLTSVLGQGATPISKTWGATTASSVFAEICDAYGISYSFDVVDWAIEDGALVADGIDPIDVLNKIAKATGAILQSSTTGTLHIVYKFKTPPPLYDSATPDIYISDVDDIFSVQESRELTSLWNSVKIIGQVGADSAKYTITQIDEDPALDMVTLKVVVYPFKDSVILYDSMTSGVVINSLGKTTETVTETIEIVNGSGSVSNPIVSISSSVYLGVNLGTISFSENTITTTTLRQSLVTITYVTEYHTFEVLSAEDKVQVYTEEVV